MQHLEVSGAVRHIYVIRQLKVNVILLLTTRYVINAYPFLPPPRLFLFLWR